MDFSAKNKFILKGIIYCLIQSFLVANVSLAFSQDFCSRACERSNLSPKINLNAVHIKDEFSRFDPNFYMSGANEIISSLDITPELIAVDTSLSGANLVVGIGKEIEIRARIKVRGNITDANQLEVILHSNIEDSDNWTNLNISADNIKNVYDEYSEMVPGVFDVKIRLTPPNVGNYGFRVGAKLKGEEKFLFQAQQISLQVQLLPSWFNRANFHPAYIFLPDASSLGYSLNWTGIRTFIEDMASETGKNVFILSPFFPTPGQSPFTPLSVFAISPRFIDWKAVQDEGVHPLEKYLSFMKGKKGRRYSTFKKFSSIKEIQEYAQVIQKRIHQFNGKAFYGDTYKLDDFRRFGIEESEIIQYLIYEQFVSFEQFSRLLVRCKENNIRILGDIPFYRVIDGVDAEFNRHYFDTDNDGILSPGFKGGNEQIWGDLAAWNEHWIKQQVDAGKKDPRILPFEYWDSIFAEIFGLNDLKISGWRLDALHFYGRGSYKYNAERLYYDTALWDNLAKYFLDKELLAVVEQLGGDAHAYYHFSRLGFFQYAFILDLKPKSLKDMLADIASISRGAAFTVVDTHDSWRWAKEYREMFEYLTGIYKTSEDESKRRQMFKNVAPLFLALLMLCPKTETTLLSLGEYATGDNIKTEEYNEEGVVIGSKWGTKNVGPVDLSDTIKKFINIRQENKAISNSPMTIIPNNDAEYLVSVAKSSEDNNILIVGNFSSKKREIKCLLPFREFNINTSSRIRFTDLMTNKVVENDGPILQYELNPGQVCVFKVEQIQNDAVSWLKEYCLRYITDYEQRLYAQSLIEKFKDRGKFATEDGIDSFFSLIDSNANAVLTSWDWSEDKNKEIMIGAQSALKIINEKPFIIYLYDIESGHERYIPAFRLKEENKYIAILFGLGKSRYKFTFLWPQKTDNSGWEGRDYFLRVLPSPEQIGRKTDFENLVLLADEKTFNKYPHNTITLANGIGSILRMPVRPLQRNQWEGTIEVAGLVSKYDGFQANLHSNSPDESRRVLFRGIVEDVSVVINGKEKSFNLSIDNLESFNMYLVPTWRFVIEDEGQRLVIEKKAVLVQNKNRFILNYTSKATKGIESVIVYLRPDVDMRMHHEVTKYWDGAMEHWASKHRQEGDSGCRFYPINDDWRNWYPGFEGLKMFVTNGIYTYAPEWHYSLDPIEAERGQDAVSDAYSPGFFSIDLLNHGTSSFVFSSIDANTEDVKLNESQVQSLIRQQIELQVQRISKVNNPFARRDSFVQKMVLGLWQFIAKRDKFYTVIAGYPWFSDWGRDTFICFDGLLSAGMYDIAKGLILVFGKFETNGMLPNIITGETAGNWDTVDAPLLYVLSVRNYITETQDKGILDEYAGDRTVRQVIESIVNGYRHGTQNGIKMDDDTKLIWSPSHFTWMDTNYPACTPRQGYTVENNARWFDVLMFAADILNDEEKARELENIAQQVKNNFVKNFWTDEKGGYLADNIEANKGESAASGRQDLAIRQNQLIAVLSSYDLLDEAQKQQIVQIVQDKLLVPGALRTLSEDTFSREEFSYQGVYYGDEDTQRKPAYHNGTAWPHLFGDWAVAYIKAFGTSRENIRYVLSFFGPIEEHLGLAGMGSVSEVIDGNAPHYPRGCDAQAWSIANNLAAYMKIRYSQGKDRLRSEVETKQDWQVIDKSKQQSYSEPVIEQAI